MELDPLFTVMSSPAMATGRPSISPSPPILPSPGVVSVLLTQRAAKSAYFLKCLRRECINMLPNVWLTLTFHFFQTRLTTHLFADFFCSFSIHQYVQSPITLPLAVSIIVSLYSSKRMDKSTGRTSLVKSQLICNQPE